VSVANAATRQRQVLRDLAAEHGRHLRQILQAGELVKGSTRSRRVAATRAATALSRAAGSIPPPCFPGVTPAATACPR
jgi:hypothetical protein